MDGVKSKPDQRTGIAAILALACTIAGIAVPATARDRVEFAVDPGFATLRLKIETNDASSRYPKLRRSIETVENELDALHLAYRTELVSGHLDDRGAKLELLVHRYLPDEVLATISTAAPVGTRVRDRFGGLLRALDRVPFAEFRIEMFDTGERMASGVLVEVSGGTPGWAVQAVEPAGASDTVPIRSRTIPSGSPRLEDVWRLVDLASRSRALGSTSISFRNRARLVALFGAMHFTGGLSIELEVIATEDERPLELALMQLERVREPFTRRGLVPPLIRTAALRRNSVRIELAAGFGGFPITPSLSVLAGLVEDLEDAGVQVSGRQRTRNAVLSISPPEGIQNLRQGVSALLRTHRRCVASVPTRSGPREG